MTDEPSPHPKAPKKQSSGWLNLLVDYGPLLVFFLVYRLYAPKDENDAFGTLDAVIRSTSAFVIAAIAALIFSKVKLGRISPMLWLSTALIVGLRRDHDLVGDPWVIQLKPTIDLPHLAASP